MCFCVLVDSLVAGSGTPSWSFKGMYCFSVQKQNTLRSILEEQAVMHFERAKLLKGCL